MTPEEISPKAICAHSQPQQTSTAQRMVVIVAIAAFVLLMWQLSDVLLLLFGAIIFATALRAVAAPIERYMRLSPRLAVATAIFLASAIIVTGTWLIGDRMAEQFYNLRQRVPEALAALTVWLNNHPIGLQILEVLDSSKVGGVPWVKVANVATLTVGAIGAIGLVLVLAVYLAVDPAQYRQGFVRLIPPAYRDQIDAALEASWQALSKWLMGQGISMLFVGSATGIGLAALGMPLALSLGVIAGVLAFIPFFGPIASGVLAVILAFMEGPTQALYVAGLCIVIQQIEGNFVMPFVQRWAVELPPVLGIIAAVIFGLLFGIVGVVFATPLMVVAMVLVQKLYIEGVLESGSRYRATATRTAIAKRTRQSRTSLASAINENMAGPR